MNKLLVFFLITLQFNMLESSSYTISLSGAEKISGDFYQVGINDQGQVFGCLDTKPGCVSGRRIYISDSEKGLLLVPTNSNSSFNMYNEKVVLNNNNEILVHHGNAACVWSPNSELNILNIFNRSPAIALDLNDVGQVIGITRGVNGIPFLWDNGIVTAMGPGSEFGRLFEERGFHPIEIRLSAINNKGEIAGSFSFGKYNKIKDEFVVVGTQPFHWNGELNIIPLTLKAGLHEIFLNNESTVLISQCVDYNYPSYSSYLWNIMDGIQTIPNFRGYALNDFNVILGELYGIPTIWEKGSFTTIEQLLGVQNLNDLAPPYSDDYRIERIKDISDINNKKQIVALGFLWGEWHPCILEPIQK